MNGWLPAVLDLLGMLGPAPAAQAYYTNQGTAFNPPLLFGLATVDATPLTARRTQSLQDDAGTIALTKNIPAQTLYFGVGAPSGITITVPYALYVDVTDPAAPVFHVLTP